MRTLFRSMVALVFVSGMGASLLLSGGCAKKDAAVDAPPPISSNAQPDPVSNQPKTLPAAAGQATLVTE